MTDRESGGGHGLAANLKLVGMFAGAAALALLPATCVFNGAASRAEFNGVQAQVMMLVEQGKLTAKDGSPQPYLAKYKGQEFAINLTSALRTQNGQYRDAGGQVVQDSQTQTGDGAMRSQSYSSGYTVQGQISRVKGSESFFRPFYNDGGTRAFTFMWEGTKPNLAPLSNQPTLGTPAQVQIPAPNPATVVSQAPAAPAPAGPAG